MEVGVGDEEEVSVEVKDNVRKEVEESVEDVRGRRNYWRRTKRNSSYVVLFFNTTVGVF